MDAPCWVQLAGDNHLDTVTWVRLGGYVIWGLVFDYGVDRKDNLPLGFSFSLVWQAGKSKANVLYEGGG